MGDSITEGQIAEWTKNVGDYVQVDDLVVLVDTDKVAQDINSPVQGKVVAIHAEEGDTVSVDDNLIDIEVMAELPAEANVAASPEPTPEPASEAAPAPAKEAAPPSPPPPPPPKEASTSTRTEIKEPMTRLRKTIARRLKESQDTAASLTTFNEIDMTNLIALRNKHKDDFLATHGVKLGFMSPFLKACANTLMEIPAVNSATDGDNILLRDFVDISVAVATPDGLVTPVVRDVQGLSLAEIELTIADLAARARDKKLAIEDLSGGTFTISNGGIFGNLMGTPIINLPQSAVFGMHATKMRAAVVDGEVVARPMMYIALTYDHRIIDGREAATFLCRVRDKIEDPTRMLLEI